MRDETLLRRTRAKRFRAILPGAATGLLVVAALGAVLLWRYRYTVLHLARLAWDRWTLPAIPQETPPGACP